MKSSTFSLILVALFTVGCGGGGLTSTVASSPLSAGSPAPNPPPPPPPTPTPPPPVPTPPPSPPPTPPTPPPPPSLPSSWTATDLPPVDGAGAAQANAINSSGQVVGYSVMNGQPRITLWEDGKVADLGDGVASGINDFGQIVGYTINPVDGKPHGFYNTTITVYDLGPLGDFDSAVATGVNNSGDVVGVMFSSANPNRQSAFIFKVAGGAKLVDGCASAEAINDSGQIAGVGANLDAAICGSADFAQQGAAVAINSLGQAVGYAANDAWLFPNMNLGPTLATGINDNGWVVGSQITPLQGNARVMTPMRSHIARLSAYVVGTSQPGSGPSRAGSSRCQA